jgi:hypothetical protein
MIKIRINDVEQDVELRSIDESWINQQINRRRAEGLKVCVRITIQVGDLDLFLSTPTCQTGAGSSRPLRPHEKVVCALWNEEMLDEKDFTGGRVVAFLKRLRQLI